MRRIILSDVHLSSEQAVTGILPNRRPWAWCSAAQGVILAEFLESEFCQTADKLILAGDVLDAWICPVDLRPPTIQDAVCAPHNDRVITRLRNFPGELIMLPGNHDMALTVESARLIRADVVFGRQYDEGVLGVRHGHEHSLFNAPDPAGRAMPLGYWLSRFSATGVAAGGVTPGTDLWSILVSGTHVLSRLVRETFAECVFDETLRQTGVLISDSVIAPWGASILVSDLREQYASLMSDWDACGQLSSEEAILAEWDPYYGVPVGTTRIHVWGHSHQQLVARHPSYGIYMNTGSWCGPNGPCFVEVSGSPECMTARGFAWDAGSKMAIVLTDEIGL